MGDVYFNIVKFIMEIINGNYCEVMGLFIGGGNIRVCKVNSIEVDFIGMYEILIIV